MKAAGKSYFPHYIATLTAMAGSFLSPSAGHAYPEYQQFIEKHSGRTVNCAMCHVNENGPVGVESGQIGSLNSEELQRLNKARGALMPGQDIDSPILNQFGDEIIKQIGKKAFIEMKADPGRLAVALGSGSDLDQDGIFDSVEYLDGTDPLNKFHGDPGKLLAINLRRYKLHVLLAVVAVGLLNFGLVHLVKGISVAQASRRSNGASDC